MESTNTTSFSMGTMVVNEKLTEANFENWTKCMKHYLIGQGLWGVVSGKEANRPKETDYSFKDWNKKNSMALYAIQTSCHKDTFSTLMTKYPTKVDDAKFVWQCLTEMDDDVIAGRHIEDPLSVHHYFPLYMALIKGEWNAIKGLLERNPNDVKSKITMIGLTPLHLAVLAGKVEIVIELLKLLHKEDLEKPSNTGYTAFTIAAMTGAKDMLEAMFKLNKDLIVIKNDRTGLLPVVTASLYGKKKILQFLIKNTPIEYLSPETDDKNGATLLNRLISAEIYDEALKLLRKYPQLAVTKDNRDTYAIHLLANKRTTFRGASKLGCWKRWMYSCASHDNIDDDISIQIQSGDDIQRLNNQTSRIQTKKVSNLLVCFIWRILQYLVPKSIKDLKKGHIQALQILRLTFENLRSLSKEDLENIQLDQIIYDAIKCGSFEFIHELIKSNPQYIWVPDRKGRTLFANALILREEGIFDIIYELGEVSHLLMLQRDVFNNNFLHLAAKLSPDYQLEQVSGAALQMQRELQWFKKVEGLVPPSFKEQINGNGETPKELFTKEHKELEREGESWMKTTTASCMVVAALIATMMFTTAFTVPGGTDGKTGFPIFLGYNAFLVFIISNAVSLFSSCTCVLVFLGILTSRYAEYEFLKSLPQKLILGLFTLFISVVTMMIAFGSAIFILLQKRLSWIATPVIISSIIPIAFFIIYQFPLLFRILINTPPFTFLTKSKIKKVFSL